MKHAEKFFAQGDFIGRFNPHHFVEWLFDIIEADEHVVLIGETGSACVSFFPVFYSGVTACQENWVYGENGEGRKLMEACELVARERGAHTIGVSAQVSKRGETVAKMYERKNYTRREIALTKEL